MVRYNSLSNAYSSYLRYNTGMIFRMQPMSEILQLLQKDLEDKEKTTFEILDPDLFRGEYAGTVVEVEEYKYLYRSLHAWMELAEILGCRMLVPRESTHPLLKISFEKIAADSFHTHDVTGKEKYGSNSLFSRIHKMEEPSFYFYYKEALKHAKLPQRKRILNLGINRGDEFEVVKDQLDGKQYEEAELLGIDHSESAIERAKALFPEPNVSFHACDINDLASLQLGRFDLLISIGTLQSPSINFKPMLMHLVQEYLQKDDAAVILGFPNSRWKGGEVLYGAKAAHYNFSEMGVVLEDILFAKKYLQQKKYRVMITGKHYLFLTAVRIGQEKNRELLTPVKENSL